MTDASVAALWMPATVSSLGAPPASVATMTVEPDEPAARNAARRAANTAGSSPFTSVLRRPTVTSTPSPAAACSAASIAGRRCGCRRG